MAGELFGRGIDAACPPRAVLGERIDAFLHQSSVTRIFFVQAQPHSSPRRHVCRREAAASPFCPARYAVVLSNLSAMKATSASTPAFGMAL